VEELNYGKDCESKLELQLMLVLTIILLYFVAKTSLINQWQIFPHTSPCATIMHQVFR